MAEKRVTLKDIAQLGNCSAAVVSTVLNGANGNTVVSAKMRAKIQGIANQLGYRPNFASRSLRLNSMRTIGIYVQNGAWRKLSSSYEMDMFKGVERAVKERQYDLLLLNIVCDALPEVCAHKIAEHRIDGVILLHADGGAEWISRLLALSENVIAIDYTEPVAGLDATVFDNAAAIETAVAYLAGLGHRHIGYIGTVLETPPVDSACRAAAFVQALARHGLEFRRELVFARAQCPRELSLEEHFCQLEGELGMEYLLRQSPRPTAVIAYNTLVATTALAAARVHNVAVPEELSIIGIDDTEFARYTEPPLSVIDHPLEAMGYAGAMLLIDKIERIRTGTERLHFAPTLIQRGSTGPCRNISQ